MTVLVTIVGATGTGKSGLSLDLAEALAKSGKSAEIINADAMQLYRGMDIGTAKLSEGERRGIPHHMLDVLDPSEEASVAAFQVDALAAIAGVEERGAIPILVGGSGLYVSSVIYDFQFPGTDAAIRARLEDELIATGPGMLYQQLLQKDPAAAEAIGPSNGRRLVRALEVIEMTGEPFGSGLPDENAYWRDTVVFGLAAPREELVPRLNERVVQMWRDGLLGEAERLQQQIIGVTAARAIGYAQAFAQLRGELPQEDAIEQTAALTRRYARRQVGWFRRYPGTTWLDAGDPRNVESAVAAIVAA
ncbi:tRNA (adenosine(37)-N6)-dimethylallyltransferase MiaA [Glaciihabitans arcticus]|uniref:tRNA dimethylallyltransferase n=1 Tax=Glaciihabitans arcticus TaxID=2668039 RepID=A0A4V2JEQ3_9MICO|nr:tRNA (adenosine(37)-N6)-dimethylallyltransferase MiaA [Glaciihabitans arcticus]TBN56469.1 tRNA (adenosine(37)-N6)-dimethylallyltransferase MiaA [Glaciihabitans arcticus]